MIKITDTVKHLIIINVILWAATQLAVPQLQNSFALHFPANPEFGFWQYITSMFMHDQRNIMHLAFNMLGVWMFGSSLEQIWGRNKFLFFYFSTGIGAGLIYTAVNYFQYTQVIQELLAMGGSKESIQELIKTLDINSIYNVPAVQHLNELYNTRAVGASGALYGVLVAFGMMFPNAKLALIFFPVPIAAKYFIPVLIAFDLISGLFGNSLFGNTGIAHWAHIGGALTGLIIMLYWKKHNFKRWN